MSVALLHRRLTAAMALSALLAFMAGAGVSPEGLLAAGVLCFAAFRLPPESWGTWIERASRLVILGLCAWMLYVAFVLGGRLPPRRHGDAPVPAGGREPAARCRPRTTRGCTCSPSPC